jgi:predicted TIM-barrel fold metal-dependent hydrolase
LEETVKKLALVVMVLAVALASTQCTAPAPVRKPIIDMHLHALPADFFGQAGLPNPATGQTSAAITDEAIREATLAALKRYNIVRAATSGPLPLVREWHAAAPERILPAVLFAVGAPGMEVATLREEFTSGRFVLLGEILAQYQGLTLSDPAYDPYLEMAEEMEIPVALHTGHGPPGATYEGSPAFRAHLGNPLLNEEALARHPKLRIYLMHAGYPFLEETIALLHAHPHVYADLSVINWINQRQDFHRYLRQLLLHADDCHLDKRLMFGSDQMIWPEAIGMAVEGIESARFLTAEQKRDIFCRNAARFLRLDPAVCE